jgi:monoterpene epsilon-lactone hydrolase
MEMNHMISVQGFFLRTFLRLRKAGMKWDAPVGTFRANLAISNRFIKLPQNAEVKPDLALGVPIEWIIPPNTSPQFVILYIHGGGWTLGWTNLHRRMVMHLCQAAACRALAIDYRLAPEHPFPAALEDCLATYHWLLKNGLSPQNIVIAGDSAGANLTLTTLMSLRDTGGPLPAAAVCLSPMIDLAGTGETLRTKNDVAQTVTFVLSMARLYAGNHDVRLPLLSPYYGDLRGFPPLLIQVGGEELLLSDATRLANNARAAAVDVNLVIWPGMWHVWHLFVPFLPEAQHAINDIGAFIRRHIS